jgi:hypothetical protein
MQSFTKTTVKTFTPIWVKESYSTYSKQWKNIRDIMDYKANECFKCNKKFSLGDTISLACFKNVGNKVLCKDCAAGLMSN